MGERIRAFDWAPHPLGPPGQWPGALRMAISLCLNSSFPTAIYWGPDFHVLYNDAWSVIPADKHPAILGMPAREGWSDIWDIVGPQFEQVFASGEGQALYDRMLPMVRGGRVTETWWNYSLTAIRHADHSIGGIFNQGNEITEVVHARHQREAELGRWREVFQQAPAAVALMRGADHVFEFTNPAYQQLIGNREVTGKPLTLALPEIADQGFPQLLDTVLRTGQPHVGLGTPVRLQRHAGQPAEDCVLDFVYQPLRDADGRVDGVFVLATDVTDRARAEAALRRTNWQLGEERARLAALIEAEQRTQQALRRSHDTLEAHVRQRTVELTRALDKETTAAQRLRAAFETSPVIQVLLDADGVAQDANPSALDAIRGGRHAVLGRPLWDAPWFAATPGMREAVRGLIERAGRGETVRMPLPLELPDGQRDVLLSLRPVTDAGRTVTGLVAEAIATAGDPAAPASERAGPPRPAAAGPSRAAAGPSRPDRSR